MEKKEEALLEIIRENRRSGSKGIYSICSANPFVLEAGISQAKTDGSIVCIESTSNQVDQFGGYTGMTPDRFVRFVREIARKLDFPFQRVILGGDHLGPNSWRDTEATAAMGKAGEQIRACINAGYTKIHLDASMRCADDPGGRDSVLAEETVARRTADLASSAEEAWEAGRQSFSVPLYVIGSEVPAPGGAREQEAGLTPTRAEDARKTIEVTKDAFLRKGLEEAWERVIAVVVQPGVEFNDNLIFEYKREKAKELSLLIEEYGNLVFEAHSTDYQTHSSLSELVEDHFCILKVGPALTFAFREAVFALEEIEREILGKKKDREPSRTGKNLEKIMLKNPKHWLGYYRGDENQLRLARRYGFSDRCRYYWTNPQVQKSLDRLFSNLSGQPIPLTLLSQFMPVQYSAVREGRIEARPRELILAKIMEVTNCYASACRIGGRE